MSGIGPRYKPAMIKWLRSAIEIGEEGMTATTIELCKRSPVDRTLVEGIKRWMAPFPEPAEMVRQIDERVSIDVDSEEEPIVGYLLRPTYGKATDPYGNFPFKVENIRERSEAGFSDAVMDGAVGQKGQLADARRHNLDLIKITTEPQLKFMERQQAEIDRLRYENEQMRMEREKVWLALQKLQDRTQDRQLKAAQAVASQERKSMFLKQALQYVPLLINQFLVSQQAQHPGAPQNFMSEETSVDLEAWKMFFNALTPEERQEVFRVAGLKAMGIMPILQKWQAQAEGQQAEFREQVDRLTPEMPAAENPFPTDGSSPGSGNPFAPGPVPGMPGVPDYRRFG